MNGGRAQSSSLRIGASQARTGMWRLSRLRAARRGRWHARMINTFGWVMTLVIAGSIIGLAGHYLGLSPASIQTTLQARP